MADFNKKEGMSLVRVVFLGRGGKQNNNCAEYICQNTKISLL